MFASRSSRHSTLVGTLYACNVNTSRSSRHSTLVGTLYVCNVCIKVVQTLYIRDPVSFIGRLSAHITSGTPLIDNLKVIQILNNIRDPIAGQSWASGRTVFRERSFIFRKHSVNFREHSVNFREHSVNFREHSINFREHPEDSLAPQGLVSTNEHHPLGSIQDM
jgi:hypothetical protein